MIEQSSSQRNDKQFPELHQIRLASIGNQDEGAFNKRVSQKSLKSQKSHKETAIFSLKTTLMNEFIPEALLLSFLEIEKAPRLMLKETKGNVFNSKTLFINACGLVSKDDQQISNGGLSFFWCNNSELIPQTSPGTSIQTSNILNIIPMNQNKPINTKIDYKLNVNYPQKLNNYLFMIYYNPDNQSYKLKFHHIIRPSINTKPDILIKLTNSPIPIIVSVFVCFGAIKLLVKTLGNGILEITDIITKKKSVYSPLTTQTVTIGKGKECSLSFIDNPLLGDIQLSIVYDCFKKQWMLQSNDIINSLQISNWFFGIDSYEICKLMEVKILNTEMRIEVVE